MKLLMKQLPLSFVSASVFLLVSGFWLDLSAKADSWEGVWAFEKEGCQYSDEIGYVPGPIKVTRNEFVGLENWCTVTNLNAVGGEMILDLACEGEGTASTDRIFLRAEGNSLRIRRAGEETLEYHRCE